MRKIILSVMAAALFTLAYAVDQKVLEDWAKTMRFGISTQRAGVIKAIEDNKAAEAYYLVETALTNDENENVRSKAVYALINLRISNDRLWIGALGKETNTEVLRQEAFAVSELKVKTAGPALVAVLTNHLSNARDNILCATVVRAIGDIEYKPAASLVIGILSNMEFSQELRSAAAIAVGTIGGPANMELLTNIVKNPGEVREVRMYAAYSIGRLGDPRAGDVLLPIVDDEMEDLNIRLWALAGMVYVKNDSIFPKLIYFSRVDNVRIRIEAIKALGKFNKPQAIEVLTYKAMYDPELSVKREAKKALQGLGIELDSMGKPTNGTTNVTLTNQAARPVMTNMAVTTNRGAVLTNARTNR